MRALLDRVAARLGKCEPEEYELDKGADVSATTGLRNLLRGQLLLGCYEVAVPFPIYLTHGVHARSLQRA
jgi:hypothetical protein